MTKKVVALVVLLVVLGGLAAAYFVGGEDLMGRMRRFSGGKGTITEEKASEGKGSNYITRGELTRYVVGYSPVDMLGTYPTNPTFTDVPTFHYYYKYIESAADAGLVDAYQDGLFKPENNVTRSEAAKIYVEAFDFPLCPAAYTIPTFDDVDAADWQFESVETLVHNGMGSLMGSGDFNPGKNITKTDVIAWGKFLKDVGTPSECTTVDVVEFPEEFVCPTVVQATQSYSTQIDGSEQTVAFFKISSANEDLDINEMVVTCTGTYTENPGFNGKDMKISVEGNIMAVKSTAQDPCTEGTTISFDNPLSVDAGDPLVFEVLYDTYADGLTVDLFNEHITMKFDQLKGDADVPFVCDDYNGPMNYSATLNYY